MNSGEMKIKDFRAQNVERMRKSFLYEEKKVFERIFITGLTFV